MKNSNFSDKLFDKLLYVFFVMLCLVMLYPFYNSIIISVMTAVEATDAGIKIFPKTFTLNAYIEALQSDLLIQSYINTILRTVILALCGTFLTFCGAYPLAKKSLPYRSLITLILVIPMFFSGGLIPSFLLIKSLGIYNTFLALLLPGLISTYNILIMRNFIMGIPESLEESALIDGAGFFTIMIKIIIPLSIPIMATIALWVSVATWNEWFNAMIYTEKSSLMVLQLLLRKAIIENASNSNDSISGNNAVVTKSIQAATIMISIGPIVAVYPFFQKYFVKGILIGSVKG